MIFNVLWTLFFFRGASSALGTFPYDVRARGPRSGVGQPVHRAVDRSALDVLESVGLLLHIGVMLAFL